MHLSFLDYEFFNEKYWVILRRLIQTLLGMMTKILWECPDSERGQSSAFHTLAILFIIKTRRLFILNYIWLKAITQENSASIFQTHTFQLGDLFICLLLCQRTAHVNFKFSIWNRCHDLLFLCLYNSFGIWFLKIFLFVYLFI